MHTEENAKNRLEWILYRMKKVYGAFQSLSMKRMKRLKKFCLGSFIMEIDLRIPDDYCQGEASTLEPLDDDFFEEDRIKRSRIKIRPRGRKTVDNP